MTKALIHRDGDDLDVLAEQPTTQVKASQLKAGMVLVDELNLPAALLLSPLQRVTRSGATRWDAEDLDDGSIIEVQLHLNKMVTVAACKPADNTCQHCHGEVQWGRTEQGFAGFVHTATGLAACPKDAR